MAIINIDRRSRTLFLLARICEFSSRGRWDAADVDDLCLHVIHRFTGPSPEDRRGIEAARKRELRALRTWRRSITRKRAPLSWRGRFDSILAELDADIENLARTEKRRKQAPEYDAFLRIIAEATLGSDNSAAIGKFVDRQLKKAKVPPPPKNKRAQSVATRHRESLRKREQKLK